MRAGGIGSRRRIDSAVTLLPQPDSPTIASVSPGIDVEAHAVDRAHDAVARVEVRLQVVDAQQRFAWRPWSQPPRKPRVERVAHSIPEQIHRQHRQRQEQAGNRRMVGATWMRLRASAMMLPQLGMLGGVPAPMNDRMASVIIADAQM